MKLLAFALMAVTAAAEGQVAPSLSFDEAVALAEQHSRTGASSSLPAGLAAIRMGRLPSVRAEVMGNASRTLDLFTEGPLEVRYATTAIAFDYPLWDGGVTSARLAAAEARLRAGAGRSGLDDARFAQLLDAFGELYLTQKQMDAIRPVSEQVAVEAARTSGLVDSGEITNLAATERREIALAFESRMLDLEARRLDAANRMRILTAVEVEPAVVLDFSEAAPAALSINDVADDLVRATTAAVEQSRARLVEVRAGGGIRATLSGFGGIGAADSKFRGISSEGSFGVYALRMLFSYPLFGGTNAVSIAEARADLEQSESLRDAAIAGARARASEYRLREETSRKRIALLQKSLAAAKEREESVQRLVAAGVRSETDFAAAQSERIRRETDLLTAEIDRWKAARMLARMVAAAASGLAPHPAFGHPLPAVAGRGNMEKP